MAQQLGGGGSSSKNNQFKEIDEDDEMYYSPQSGGGGGGGNGGGGGGGDKLTGSRHLEQLHQSSKVDISNLNRGIWLVKVPKYLATRWERISGDVEAAKLRIGKDPLTNKPKVTLSLSESTLCLKQPGEQDIPKDHELMVQPMASQCLGVFSTREEDLILPPSEEDRVGGESTTNPETLVYEKVIMEGKIQQRLDCRPVADHNYLKLKLDEIRKSSQPARQVMVLERPVNTYKPVADHKNNIEFEERKKAEGKKSRDDKDKVLEMLFSAFEKHQYYNLKDLVTMTNQPVGYLKEVLKEVCNYCMKNPHKNMWELKPEYRHYKSEDPPAGGRDGGGSGDDDDDDEDMVTMK